MNLLKTSSLLLLAVWQGSALAHIQLVPAGEPQRVFGGEARTVSLVFSNEGGKSIEADLRTRMLQVASVTAVPIGEAVWKKLSVLPGQTVLETAALDFPAVKAETRFIVQWIEGTNKVIGSTEVMVYPTNLLSELNRLAGEAEGALGIFDPQDRLKPLLKAAAVDFKDLGEGSLEDFRGKLAIIGPFESKAQMSEGLARRVETLAKNGVAVVWILPPRNWRAKLQPSFYAAPYGDVAVIVVQPELVTDLADSPRSQLNLIHFAQLALHPEPPHLPFLNPEQ